MGNRDDRSTVRICNRCQGLRTIIAMDQIGRGNPSLNGDMACVAGGEIPIPTLVRDRVVDNQKDFRVKSKNPMKPCDVGMSMLVGDDDVGSKTRDPRSRRENGLYAPAQAVLAE